MTEAEARAMTEAQKVDAVRELADTMATAVGVQPADFLVMAGLELAVRIVRATTGATATIALGKLAVITKQMYDDHVARGEP